MSSRLASVSFRTGVAAIALVIGGPLINQLGAPPMAGFYAFALGMLVGLVALVLGALGLFATRGATGRSGRGQAVFALGAGLAILVAIGVSAGSGGGVPPINDITTNPEDPPEFVAALELEANRGRDMSYPGEEFASQQRQGYSDLAPIEVTRAPAVVYTDILAIGPELGWEITRDQQSVGEIEATHTTRVFRFVDDIVVRVRPLARGSVVDVRSKSRDGRSDLGANAARIRALREALGS